MTAAVFGLLLTLAQAAPVVDPQHETRIVLKRYESRKGVKLRWFVAGKQVADAFTVRLDPAGLPATLVDEHGVIPRQSAVEIDDRGRVVADWTVCPGPGLRMFKIRNYDAKGRKTYELEPAPGKGYCPQNGVGRLFHPNGRVATEITYKDDLANGPQITYYEDGSVKSRSTLVNGKLEGEGRHFHRNGKLSMLHHYVRGEAEGVSSSFDEEGRKKLDVTMVHSKPHGPATHYRPNGSIEKIEHYQDGKVVRTDAF